MVCATPRNEPNKEYLELEVQPAVRVIYTLRLEIIKNIKTPHLKKLRFHKDGYRDHIIIAKKSPIVGAIKKGRILANVGTESSFENSFSASAKGWGIPIAPTLLGPFRIWKYPNALRSSKVKNAIAAKIMIYVINEDEKEDNITLI